jgi:hypothetical protein
MPEKVAWICGMKVFCAVHSETCAFFTVWNFEQRHEERKREQMKEKTKLGEGGLLLYLHLLQGEGEFNVWRSAGGSRSFFL